MSAHQIRGFISGRDARPLPASAMDARACAQYRELSRLGINLSDSDVAKMHAYGMDSTLTALTTTASIGTPVQFLQHWLPGFVEVMTAPRNIDLLIGMAAVGSWEDEEIVQGIKEATGKAAVYGDQTNIPLASWNANFERRTVVRFEQGFQVGQLEEARAARMNVNSGADKRAAAGQSLEINRNLVGFYGYNDGANRTYGFLNDPALPSYEANIGPAWASATFLEITANIRAMVGRLITQSKGLVDPRKTSTTLALANAVVNTLSITNTLGTQSVADWMKQTYPMMRVESAPELDLANGGANVGYMYADSIADGGSDGGAVWLHAVPTKFQILGVEKTAKGYKEDFTNATAGAFLKRPFAVTRITGI